MEDFTRVIPFILDRLAEQRLAFFIGAGLPASEAGLPSGRDLRDRLAAALGEDVPDETLQDVASRFEAERDRNQLFDVIRGALAFGGDLSAPSICPSYKIIAQLPVDVLMTTNFDALLEEVLSQHHVQHRVFRTDKQLANYGHKEKRVLKIHGDIESPPDEIVITSKDYADYMERFPLFCRRIDDIFQTHTVVFLGYSLEDPDFRQLYDAVLDRVARLKMKCFAVLHSDPGRRAREYWLKRKVDFIISTGQQFLTQLLKAHRGASMRLPPPNRIVRVVRGRTEQRPSFNTKTSPAAVRKAFAYFTSRRKSILVHELCGYCTVDTLQTAVELVDPERRISREVLEKASDIQLRLKRLGFVPTVLPHLDQMPAKARERRIEEANFCVVIVSSLSYEGSLNRFYGPVAEQKPILVFVHDNFRARLREDMVFPGLEHVGAHVGLFRRADLFSCNLWKAIGLVLEAKRDEWLAAALHLARRWECKEVARLLSFDCLFILALLHSYKRLSGSVICRLVGVTLPELENRLSVMEALKAIRGVNSAWEVQSRGRRIARALELYRFNFARPAASLGMQLAKVRTKRRLAVNAFYAPDLLRLEGV